MERVRVVGSAGSGKTTVAAVMAERLGLPHLELDTVNWLPGWEQQDHDEFRRTVHQFAGGPSWVMDGNYFSRLGDSIEHLVDTYVWLDLPRWRVATALIRRTVLRAVARTELWDTGNRERLSSLFNRDPEQNVVLWSWTLHASLRERYETLSAGDPRWIRLHSRREVRRFLASLGASSFR